ncbi:coiled-coil domain-containing protein 12 [Hetaerina americana]|uniref:coiled-coil domain-containing protein 12 n=1 Tax=Hetaerina americana TaxID=62018 RepID=UPI003A7F3FA2
MSADEKVGTLEEEALKRRERLRSLKRGHDNHENENPKSEDKNLSPLAQLPKPKFRSYKPIDEKFKDNVLPDEKPADVEQEVRDQLNAANSKVVIEELDLSNLAPRKPDWDLKRDVAKKLERLERRTQKAIAELIRDRLKEGQGSSSGNLKVPQSQDLAASVEAGAMANQMPDDD